MLDVDSVAGIAASDLIRDHILSIVALAEPGKWHEDAADWESLPSATAAALVALNSSRLIRLEFTRTAPLRFRFKLDAAGEALKDKADPELIMEAIADARDSQPVLRWWTPTGSEKEVQSVSTANTFRVFFAADVQPDVKQMAQALADDPALGVNAAARKITETTGRSADGLYQRFKKKLNKGSIRFDPPSRVSTANH